MTNKTSLLVVEQERIQTGDAFGRIAGIIRLVSSVF
jgi:hypothetical protein